MRMLPEMDAAAAFGRWKKKKSMFLFAIYENLDRKRKHTFYFCQGLFRVFKGSSDVTGTKEKEKVLRK